jgi:hypothetical protein
MRVRTKVKVRKRKYTGVSVVNRESYFKNKQQQTKSEGLVEQIVQSEIFSKWSGQKLYDIGRKQRKHNEY